MTATTIGQGTVLCLDTQITPNNTTAVGFTDRCFTLIDKNRKKEYTYCYEDGKLIRSAEYDITIDANEFVVSRTAVSSIYFDYNSEGELIRKRTFVGSSLTSEIFYEKNDDSTVVKFKAGGKDVTSHSKSDSFGRRQGTVLCLDTQITPNNITAVGFTDRCFMFTFFGGEDYSGDYNESTEAIDGGFKKPPMNISSYKIKNS